MPNTSPPSETDDPVSHPTHYTQGGIEVIDFINAWEMDFLQGNVIKYTTRFRLKGGVEDLKKARQYLDWLILREERNARHALRHPNSHTRPGPF